MYHVKKAKESVANILMKAKGDINFVVKDGRQTVHAASLERLFEKLLDPYYRGTQNHRERVEEGGGGGERAESEKDGEGREQREDERRQQVGRGE